MQPVCIQRHLYRVQIFDLRRHPVDCASACDRDLKHICAALNVKGEDVATQIRLAAMRDEADGW